MVWWCFIAFDTWVSEWGSVKKRSGKKLNCRWSCHIQETLLSVNRCKIKSKNLILYLRQWENKPWLLLQCLGFHFSMDHLHVVPLIPPMRCILAEWVFHLHSRQAASGILTWARGFAMGGCSPSPCWCAKLSSLLPSYRVLFAYSFFSVATLIVCWLICFSPKIGKWDGYQVACGHSQTSSWNRLALRWICFLA